MTNHRQYVKLIWCEKNGIAFQAFLRDLPKGMKDGFTPSVLCFLRIMIFKVYRCKFSQQNSDFLK